MRSIIFLFLFVVSTAMADDMRSVGGEFTYYADVSMSLKDAKSAAIENAKLQAIAQEFGTAISQSTEQMDKSVNGKERTFFMQLSSSEVRGEWIEDTQEPVCQVVEILPDMLVLKATVSGKARAISNESVDFDAHVLRNGVEKRFADTDFKTGDDLYVRFRTPVDGYVCVYLIDETPTAYCLLPYSNDSDGMHEVKRNKEYIFFSNDKSDDNGDAEVDELHITCSDENGERNQVYVIFSPEPFTKAMDEQLSGLLPRQLSYDDFSRWLSKCRKETQKWD